MAHINKIIDQRSASTPDNLGRSLIATPEDNVFDLEERRKLLDAQKDLRLPLRLDTIKLCGILQLSVAAKNSVEMLLEYVISNHIINTELTMLQAFQISLCWTAASLLKEKVNHKESLALAKKHLNFNCKKDEVDYVYAILQCLKSTLLNCTAHSKDTESPIFAESSGGYPLKDHSNAKVSFSATCKLQNITSEIGSLSLNQECIAQNDVSKSIKQIQKKFQKKRKKYNDMHLKERVRILRSYKEEKENLEFKHKVESDVIRICSCSWRYILLRTTKPKMWEIEQEKEVEDHKHQMELRLQHLKKLQLEAASKLQKKEGIWIEELKRWVQDELLFRHSLDAPDSADSMTAGVMVSKAAGHVTDKAVACSGFGPVTVTTPPRLSSANSALDTGTSEASLFANVIGQNSSDKTSHDQENYVWLNSGAKDLDNIGDPSDDPDVMLDVNENVCSTAAEVVVVQTVNSVDGPQGSLLLNLTSLEQIPNGAPLDVPDREAPLGFLSLCEVVSEIPTSCDEQDNVSSLVTMQDKEAETGVHAIFDDLENLVALDLPFSGEHILKGATEKENSEVQETISSNHDLHNVPSMILPSSEEQNPVMIVATLQDKETEVRVLDKESNEYASLGEDQGNLVSVHSSQIAGNTTGKENSEAQVLASDNAALVNQRHLVVSTVNGNFHQELALEGSLSVQPLMSLALGESLTAHQADQDQGTDMVATSSAAQIGDARACLNQNTFQPMQNPHDGILFQSRSEDSDFNQVSQVQVQLNANLPAVSEQTDTRLIPMLLFHNCELLQNELERLGREREASLKSHEDKKLQMFLDMENGMKAKKAEICEEYETKLQQIEAELIQKNKDLLAIHKKVSNHKKLAQEVYLAFNCNGLDIISSSMSGMHQDGNFTVDRQLVRSCMQQNAQLPSLVSGSSLANPHVAFQNTPVVSLTNPASNSHIGSLSSLTRRPQGSFEIHTPLQHFQPGRPSTSVTRSFSPGDESSIPQSHRNSPLSSLLEIFLAQPPAPTQISIPYDMQNVDEIAGTPSVSVTGTGPDYQPCGNQQTQRNAPPSPSLFSHTEGSLVPTQQYVSDDVIHHPESARGLPALRSASALELLIDMSNQSSTRLRSTQYSSRLEQSSGSVDVVCLSDDD